MTDAPGTNQDEYLVVEKVNKATAGVFQIARKYSLDPADVANICITMPIKEDGETTFLERLDQSAEMTSDAVNKKILLFTASQKDGFKV